MPRPPHRRRPDSEGSDGEEGRPSEPQASREGGIGPDPGRLAVGPKGGRITPARVDAYRRAHAIIVAEGGMPSIAAVGRLARFSNEIAADVRWYLRTVAGADGPTIAEVEERIRAKAKARADHERTRRGKRLGWPAVMMWAAISPPGLETFPPAGDPGTAEDCDSDADDLLPGVDPDDGPEAIEARKAKLREGWSDARYLMAHHGRRVQMREVRTPRMRGR